MTGYEARVEARFWSRVAKAGPDDCWVWTGTIRDPKCGYGVLSVRGKYVFVHRWSFARFVRPLEPGECVCHRCDNRRCVNPAHLFAGSHSDNIQDCMAKGRHPRSPLVRTHCSQGHELSGHNLLRPNLYGKPIARQCRICENERQRRYYRQEREAAGFKPRKGWTLMKVNKQGEAA